MFVCRLLAPKPETSVAAELVTWPRMTGGSKRPAIAIETLYISQNNERKVEG